MISRGKFQHLMDLYRPQLEVFTRKGKVCMKVGKMILTNIYPVSGVNEEAVLTPFKMDLSYAKTYEDSDIYRPTQSTVYEKSIFTDGVIDIKPEHTWLYTHPTPMNLASAVIPPKGI